MKKVISLAAVILITILLFGCDDSDSFEEIYKDDSNSSAIGETAAVNEDAPSSGNGDWTYNY